MTWYLYLFRARKKVRLLGLPIKNSWYDEVQICVNMYRIIWNKASLKYLKIGTLNKYVMKKSIKIYNVIRNFIICIRLTDKESFSTETICDLKWNSWKTKRNFLSAEEERANMKLTY